MRLLKLLFDAPDARIHGTDRLGGFQLFRAVGRIEGFGVLAADGPRRRAVGCAGIL